MMRPHTQPGCCVCGRFAYIKVKEILTKKSIRYELSKQV